MALLLCIDTSTTHASVALARDEEVLCIKMNQQQKDHASFLQPAIKEIMHEIHERCLKYGREPNGHINYEQGANISGFIKVADAMLAQGVV